MNIMRDELILETLAIHSASEAEEASASYQILGGNAVIEEGIPDRKFIGMRRNL